MSSAHADYHASYNRIGIMIFHVTEQTESTTKNNKEKNEEQRKFYQLWE